MSASSISVLIVCMGNICRSPMAEGVLRKYLAEHGGDLSVTVDSAGTHGYHVGHPPDQRAQNAAAKRGVDISNLGARRVDPSDFERFDYILAMDRDNLDSLLAEAAAEYHDKVRLFLEFSSTNPGADVPDPYYGSVNGFEHVLDLVEDATEGFLKELQARCRS